jgi:hypothetical protein
VSRPSRVLAAAALAAVAAVSLLAASGSAAEPNDRRLVLGERAGPYRYLASVRRDCCTAYTDAVKAFGGPTHVRRASNTCLVTWRLSGLKVVFAGARRACTSATLRKTSWFGLRLFGRGWHDETGLRIGQPLARVRALYPGARWERRGGPGRQPWLVLKRRTVNGLRFDALAAQFDPRGRLASIHVPAAYVY